MSERQTTGEFTNYRIGERSGKTYNMIQEMTKEIARLQKENEDMREELQMYVDTDIMKLQKENEELKEQNNYYRNDIEILEELLGDDE